MSKSEGPSGPSVVVFQINFPDCAIPIQSEGEAVVSRHPEGPFAGEFGGQFVNLQSGMVANAWMDGAASIADS